MSEHVIQCWSCGTRKTLDEFRTADGYCPECEVEIDLAEYYPKLASDYDALHAEAEALRAQVSALQSDANSWQSGYDKGREDGAKAAEGWKAQHARDSAELRRLCAEREALHAEAEAMRAENGRLQVDRDRANQYANQQALECNKLSTDLEAARGLLRELRAFTLDHDDGRAGVLRGQIDAFLTATPSPDVPDNQE